MNKETERLLLSRDPEEQILGRLKATGIEEKFRLWLEDESNREGTPFDTVKAVTTVMSSMLAMVLVGTAKDDRIEGAAQSITRVIALRATMLAQAMPSVFDRLKKEFPELPENPKDASPELLEKLVARASQLVQENLDNG